VQPIPAQFLNVMKDGQLLRLDISIFVLHAVMTANFVVLPLILRDQLGLSDVEKADYKVFFQLAEVTSHIPILDEWKKLGKKEKTSFDQEREELEASFKEFIEAAAKKLLVTDGSEVTKNEPLFYSVGKE
ncbi:MAG: DUF2489 domain-containing protein, partial [Porticoccus sp.]|nr:DUF2489 domain-containing protein [Porticoccus sp.]